MVGPCAICVRILEDKGFLEEGVGGSSIDLMPLIGLEV